MLRRLLFPDAAEGIVLKTTPERPAMTTIAKALTPQMPKEPPKGGSDFSVEQLPELSAEEGGQVIELGKPLAKTESKSEEGKVTPKEEKKEEPAKEEKKTGFEGIIKPPKKAEGEKPATEVKKETGQITLLVKGEDSQFDYTSFAPAEVTVLKNMSRQSRDFTANLIKQNRELAKNKDTAYYQHPEAYTLSPEYRAVQQDIQYDTYEMNHLQKCLEQAKLGKPFRAIERWDEKGNVVLGAERQGNDASEEALRMAIMNLHNGIQTKTGSLSGYKTQYAQYVKGGIEAIQAERNKRFEWASKPEFLDYTIATAEGEKSIKQIKQEMDSLCPPHMRNAYTEVVGDIMVGMIVLQAQLAEATKGQKVAEIKQEELKRGEPSSDSKPPKQTAEVLGKVKNFSAADMPD